MTEHKRAEQPRRKTGSERQVREYERLGRRQVREKDRRERAGGRVAVEEEVVKLDRHTRGCREREEKQARHTPTRMLSHQASDLSLLQAAPENCACPNAP